MQYIRSKDDDCYMILLPAKLEKEDTTKFIDETIKLCKKDIDNNGWIFLDAKQLNDYTVSGIKELRRLHDITNNVIVLNLSNDMYDLFSNIGYVDIFYTYKEFKQFKLNNAERVGGGMNGDVYRISDDKAIKVYSEKVSLYEIIKEERITRWAFEAGLPTSCTLGLVKVEDKVALLYEYTNIKGVAKYIVDDPEHFDEYIKDYANFLKKIDTIKADTNFLPSKKKEFLSYLKDISDEIDEEHYQKLTRIINSIPEGNTIVHGDAHARNIRYSKNGLRVIDLGDLGYGDPIFELVALYATYVGYRKISTKDVVKIGNENYQKIWDSLFPNMYPELSKNELEKKENYLAALAYTRILRHCINYNELKDSINIIKQSLIQALDNI